MKMNDFYEIAKAAYAQYGIDTESALQSTAKIPVSVHCWQGDDVVGLDGGGAASNGIQTTGNYPGRARNFAELTADMQKAFSLIPGKKRLNLHASYAVLNGEKVDRDAYRPEHFAPWVKFAKEIGLDGIDFNPTIFSHKNMKEHLTDIPVTGLICCDGFFSFPFVPVEHFVERGMVAFADIAAVAYGIDLVRIVFGQIPLLHHICKLFLAETGAERKGVHFFLLSVFQFTV